MPVWMCTLGTQISTATMENNLVVPQKIKNRTTIWSSNSTSRYISNVNENSLLRHTCIPMFTSALFTIAKIRKQAKCPSIHELIKQRWYTHSEECYSATRKVESVVFARKMVDRVVDVMWCEISYREEANTAWHHFYVDYKKRKVNFRTDSWIVVARDWWVGIIGEVYKSV